MELSTCFCPFDCTAFNRWWPEVLCWCFENLGLVTPRPKLASVFYFIEIITNDLILVPPASHLGKWDRLWGNYTLSAVFILSVFLISLLQGSTLLGLLITLETIRLFYLLIDSYRPWSFLNFQPRRIWTFEQWNGEYVPLSQECCCSIIISSAFFISLFLFIKISCHILLCLSPVFISILFTIKI